MWTSPLTTLESVIAFWSLVILMIKQTERAPDADLSFPCCCLCSQQVGSQDWKTTPYRSTTSAGRIADHIPVGLKSRTGPFSKSSSSPSSSTVGLLKLREGIKDSLGSLFCINSVWTRGLGVLLLTIINHVSSDPPAVVPPTVKIHEEVKKVTAGPETNVSLSCLVEGVPQPKINWTVWVCVCVSSHWCACV